MHNYKSIIILHPVDTSTKFLDQFKKDFEDYYIEINSEKSSIDNAKSKLGDLEETSLVIYTGHGNSLCLYEPAEEDDNYEKQFLNDTWANHYLENHDVLLLSCRSNDFIRRLNKPSNLIGFGNIISSLKEVQIHNENSHNKKKISQQEIDMFNSYFVNSVIQSIKLLESGKIQFKEVTKIIEFYINKNINDILKDKSNSNRVEIAKLLFEFRDEMLFKSNYR